MSYELVKQLPEQKLAIIGDIHGEYDALLALLNNIENSSFKGRRIVFIGDLCDRGPKSISVINKVQQLIKADQAYAILGNHEINLLANDAKDGSGWYFKQRQQSDNNYYAPYEKADKQQKQQIKNFINSLPIAIQTPSVNIVHAAWDEASIKQLKQNFDHQSTGFLNTYNYWHQFILNKANANNLKEKYWQEKELWAQKLEDPDKQPPYLHHIAEFEALEQNYNPIKRITSGIEAPSKQPFFSGNRWRFSDRTSWWNSYTQLKPVLIGHYWRLVQSPASSKNWRYGALFDGVEPFAWHGLHKQVFCLDYSVGARWRERKQGITTSASKYKLAAMLWPEKQLILDDGTLINTANNTQSN